MSEGYVGGMILHCDVCGSLRGHTVMCPMNPNRPKQTITDCSNCKELASLRGELEEAKETMIRHASMLLCDDHAHTWGEFNDCPVCRAEAAEKECEEVMAERDATHAAGRREAVERCVEIAKSGKWSDKPCYCMKPEYICLPCLYSTMFISAIRAEFGGED